MSHYSRYSAARFVETDILETGTWAIEPELVLALALAPAPLPQIYGDMGRNAPVPARIA